VLTETLIGSFIAVNNSTFCGDMAKIGISRQISQNILDLPWPTLQVCRRISGDDFPNIRFAAAQGTLLRQPVKCGRRSQTSRGTTFCLSSAFDNGLADRKSAFKIFSGNNRATYIKFGEFTSSNLGVYAVKWAIFAAMHPQFDDDLHSSPCHFQTDWKIAILISAE